jgi:hypothetical protein
VYIAQLEHKDTLSESSEGVIDTFTLATGKQFWQYDLVHSTGNYSDDPQLDRQNGSNFHLTTLNLILNKREVAKRNEIINLAQNRLMIIIEDKTGTLWLMGEVNGAMMATSTSPSGTAMGDRNGYELVFNAEEAEPMSTVDPALIPVLILPAA